MRKIAVWGTGLRAAKFVYKNKIDAAFFIDNYVEDSVWKFMGKKVVKFCDIEVPGDYFILVVSGENAYMSIKAQLISAGEREFCDFCYYLHFRKKVAVLHGNCHMQIIKEYLLSSTDFCEKYALYPFIPIQNLSGKIEEEVLCNCDLFIHQDIQAANEFGYELSDEYVLPKLKDSCFSITVPNLYNLGNGFFPGMSLAANPNNKAICAGKSAFGMFPYTDPVIDKAIREGKDEKTILEVCHGEVYTEKEILDNFSQTFTKIEEREKNWDIPIYDFLMSYCKKELLFYDIGHPTNFVLRYIATEVLKMLGCSSEEIECKWTLGEHQMPIYPIVSKVLELEYKQEYLRTESTGKKLLDDMDFDEYVKEYIYWNYKID